MSVPELDAIARRIVEALNPREPSTAHERRYLHLSRRRNGTLLGQFECGPAQGAIIEAVLAAYSAPRPGLGIDADGVEHPLPDDRDPGTRRMDAMTDVFALAGAKNGIPVPAREDAEDADQVSTLDAPDEADVDTDDSTAEPPEQSDAPEPPEPEGEYRVVRPPGVLTGPLPTVELIIPVGIEHLAAALAAHLATTSSTRLPGGTLDLDLPDRLGTDLPAGLDPDLADALHDWLHRNTRHRPDHGGDPRDDGTALGRPDDPDHRPAVHRPRTPAVARCPRPSRR